MSPHAAYTTIDPSVKRYLGSSLHDPKVEACFALAHLAEMADRPVSHLS